jgi:predicted transcriptional regulator of viral defense system
VDVAGLLDHRVEISRLPDALLSLGAHAFTTKDAAEAAVISPDRARPALARLIKNRLAFSPAKGLYVPIPPQYRSWAAVPATWFVDVLLAHLGRDYYVGYLSAAEVHGAARQRPQALQVVVDRDVRDRSFGRVRLRFVTNRGVAELPTVRINTPTGTMAVSTPELTAMDLANKPSNGGGLDNVATVVIDLANDGKLNDEALAKVAEGFPASAARRVGWIVEHFSDARLDALLASVARPTDPPSNLDHHGPRRGHVDPRWRVRVNSVVEPDL